jgi:spore germination protein PB
VNWTIHQSIVIHQLRVDSVSSASVLQIGAAGSIKSLANMYNTGGFAAPGVPAPVVVPFEAARGRLAASATEGSYGQTPLIVPLPSPV